MCNLTSLFAVVSLLLSSSINVSAQSISTNLDRYFQALHRDHEMNGNVAVSENDTIIYHHSFGFKDFAAHKINDANSQFELASISKLFTATAILQLKDKGLIDLDIPFQHYFPDFPYPTITIRHLLSHTSGLPDIEVLVDSLIAKNPDKQFTIHDDLQNIIIYAHGHALKFQPGAQWSYSSAGYHLLALLIEKISGQTLAAYTHDHIFQIAGMGHSYIQTAMSQKHDPDRTKNYQYSNHFEAKLQLMDTLSDWREWTYNLALETGGSGVVSTSGDMLHFDAALNAGRLLKHQTLEEAYTPYRLTNGQPAQPFDFTYCGLGWFILKDTLQGRIVWGSGSNPGAISFFARNLTRRRSLIVLHNIKSNPFDDLKALDILNGKAVAYHASLAFIYAEDLYKDGPKYADAHLERLYPDTARYVLTESEIDRAALEFRRVGLKGQAVATCEMHVRIFPRSADAFRNYALTLAEYGQTTMAIAAYKRAVELDPNDSESKDALKKLERD